tara:strand:+ start:1277 stop:1435 length:159 start_codon:yes stop_codon:yes gene_type:complete
LLDREAKTDYINRKGEVNMSVKIAMFCLKALCEGIVLYTGYYAGVFVFSELF